jgi:phosphoserine/homoserine phosphotransferase
LTPEIWEEVSKNTGIKELMLTTKDIADYDELMSHRKLHMNNN